RHVDRTIRVQPGKMVERHPIDLSKVTADEDLTITLQRNRVNGVVGAAIKAQIYCAVGVEASDAGACEAVECAEGAADEDFVVRLEGDGKDRVTRARTWVKLSIEPSIQSETCDETAVGARNLGEQTPDEKTSIGLDCGDADGTIGGASGIERGIQDPV